MTPYVPGKPIEEVKRELGISHVVKLASNENPLGPSPLAVAAVRKAAETMHLYPDASGHALKEALAEKHGLDLNQILLGNGSDELIHLLGLILLGPGDNMVVARPTFVRYEAAAHLANIELRQVPLDAEWKHDLSAMAAACDEKTKLLFVANPHNPTGTVVNAEDFVALLESVPPQVVVVLDEAYYEYAAHLDFYPQGVDLVRSGRQVVVLRTFSKAYGLAGIRVGYGFASPEITDAIDRAREPFDVNSLAQAAAIAALSDEDHLSRSRTLNLDGLLRITREVEAMGYTVIPSFANFICIQTDRPAGDIFQALLHQGIIVRSGDPLGMPGVIRVSIGTEEEITAFLKAFSQVMQSLPV
jgi:histidinol-phosphate aminotransferase